MRLSAAVGRVPLRPAWDPAPDGLQARAQGATQGPRSVDSAIVHSRRWRQMRGDDAGDVYLPREH